jgi:hypothetical protein
MMPWLLRESHGIEHAQQDLHVPREQILGAEPPRDLRRVRDHPAPLDATDPLHHDRRPPARIEVERVHRDDVRMFERAGDPRFAQQIDRRAVLVRLEGLHRDRPAERDLLRSAHHTHPPFTDHVADPELMRVVDQRRQIRDRARATGARICIRVGARNERVAVADRLDRLGADRLQPRDRLALRVAGFHCRPAAYR